MIYGDIWWYLVISGDMWWYIMIYHDSWHMMIYDEKKWTKVDKNYCSQVDCHTFHGFLWLLREQNPDWYCWQGKRSAESDPLVGTVFLTTVQVLQRLCFQKENHFFKHTKKVLKMTFFAAFTGSKHPCQHRTGNWWKYWWIFQGGTYYKIKIQPKNLSNLQLAKLETAVKTMHSVANDQAAKYRGEMKKVPCKILNPQRALAKIDNHGWIE